MTPRPAGSVVAIYVDLVAVVEPDHVIATTTGRRYLVLEVRRQMRGKHRGRQHLRCLVLDADERPTARVHAIRWYRRQRRPRMRST